jgi:SOS-response transcriptional repressor LexA
MDLAHLLGKMIVGRADGVAWGDPRFVDWFAEETRSAERVRTRTGSRLSDEEADREGRMFRARAEARRHRLVLRVERPASSAAPVRGSVGQVMRSAASRRAAPLVDLGVAAGVGRELWDEVVEEWIELPDDMVEGQHVALRISGGSMVPLMHTGDTVLVRVGGDARVDSIVVARHPDDGYVCKRVRRLGERTIELESLDPGRPVITIPREPGLIVGTVVMVWCIHGGARVKRHKRERAAALSE